MIFIQNPDILDYALFKLNKFENGFTKDELNRITEIVYDNNELDYVNDLLLFENLSSLVLRNVFIYNSDYQVLLKMKNLVNITFDHCEFENADLIAGMNIKKLSLINCKINNYKFVALIDNLEELTIIKGNIDINIINKLDKLLFLQLSYSNILGDIKDLVFPNIQEIHIDNTNIADLSFLVYLTNLKKIAIDNKQHLNNKNIINSLRIKGIEIYNDNNYLIGGDNIEL